MLKKFLLSLTLCLPLLLRAQVRPVKDTSATISLNAASIRVDQLPTFETWLKHAAPYDVYIKLTPADVVAALKQYMEQKAIKP